MKAACLLVNRDRVRLPPIVTENCESRPHPTVTPSMFDARCTSCIAVECYLLSFVQRCKFIARLPQTALKTRLSQDLLYMELCQSMRCKGLKTILLVKYSSTRRRVLDMMYRFHNTNIASSYFLSASKTTGW